MQLLCVPGPGSYKSNKYLFVSSLLENIHICQTPSKRRTTHVVLSSVGCDCAVQTGPCFFLCRMCLCARVCVYVNSVTWIRTYHRTKRLAIASGATAFQSLSCCARPVLVIAHDGVEFIYFRRDNPASEHTGNKQWFPNLGIRTLTGVLRISRRIRGMINREDTFLLHRMMLTYFLWSFYSLNSQLWSYSDFFPK